MRNWQHIVLYLLADFDMFFFASSCDGWLSTSFDWFTGSQNGQTSRFTSWPWAYRSYLEFGPPRIPACICRGWGYSGAISHSPNSLSSAWQSRIGDRRLTRQPACQSVPAFGNWSMIGGRPGRPPNCNRSSYWSWVLSCDLARTSPCNS